MSGIIISFPLVYDELKLFKILGEIILDSGERPEFTETLVTFLRFNLRGLLAVALAVETL